MSKIFDSVNVYGSGTTTGATFRTFDSSGNNTVIIRDDGKVGIGTTSPTVKLDVRGDAIFNEDGGNFDFRIEGQSDQNLFFVDASTSSIGIGTNSTTSNEKVYLDSNNRTSLYIRNNSTDFLQRSGINVTSEGGSSSISGSAGIRSSASLDTNVNYGINATTGGIFQLPSTSFVRDIGVLASASQNPSGGNIAALGGVITQANSGDSYGIYIDVTNPGTGNKYIGRLKDGTEGNGKVLTSDAFGRATWQTPSSGNTFTGNTSASCINDLFVSNIHACSPLNINPLNEGNVHFGSSSGVTIDVSNERIGIGTNVPQYSLDILETNSRLFYDPTTVGGIIAVSGNTGVPRLGVSVAASGTRVSTGGQWGMRAWDDSSFPGYGKVGDMFIYAGNETYGLNFINPVGANQGIRPTEDYIRFYAGQLATGTADIHIQGSGSTRGYVGIGTETPTDRLTVDGKTKTTNLQVTSGAVSGYLLTSDNNGNATWQVNSATTITINNNSNNRIITATGNNDEINGESNLTFDGNTLTSIKNSSSPNLIIRDTGTTSTDAYIRFLGLSGGSPSWAMGTNKGNNSDFEIRYGSGSNTSLGNTLAFAIQSASTGFYQYQFGPNNSVRIETATDAGQIKLRDNISDVETTFSRFTNYSAIGANNGGTDEIFYINNDSISGITSFGGGGGPNDQMRFYPSTRDDLPFMGGNGLHITGSLSVDGTVRVGSVTSTGVAVYRNASTGILTTTSSDVRLKKDITQITNPLDIINNLRGVYYNWQSNDDFETDDITRQIGLIAQEVEPVLPEAVVLNGVKDYKTVKYSEIVSVLIEGMKEQQKMINDLKQEIENLKNP